MFGLRIVVVLAAVLAGVVAVNEFHAAQAGRVDAAVSVREALAMPGTGMCVITEAQSATLAAAISRKLARATGGQVGLDDFVARVRLLKRTGGARVERLYPDGRTLRDVCVEMGRLMLLDQRLARDGRRAQVTQVLKELRAARARGVPESGVQAMARRALSEGWLAPGAPDQRRQVRQELDGLAQQLVDGELAFSGEAARSVGQGTQLAGPDRLPGRKEPVQVSCL